MSKIVERTFDFLELFAEQRRPLSLSDISRLLNIPVSSAHDVVRAMQARGYLYELAPRSGFYPTLRLHTLSTTIAAHDPVVARAETLLRSLRDTLDETVLLAKVVGLSATYLMAFESSQPLRFMVEIGGDVRTPHATSAGKAMLGSLDNAALEAFLRTAKLPALTSRTLTTKDALRADIEASNTRGWFVNDGESLEGVTTLSARFTWTSSVYIVTIAAPSPRLLPRLTEAAGLLTNVCKLLETQPGVTNFAA